MIITNNWIPNNQQERRFILFLNEKSIGPKRNLRDFKLFQQGMKWQL